MKQKLIKLIRQLLGFLPSRLPQGVTEFYSWADSFSEIYDMPTQDKASIYFVLADSIMRLGANAATKSKRYFLNYLRASVSKQIAGAVFYEVKTKQQEAAKAAAAKEATVISP